MKPVSSTLLALMQTPNPLFGDLYTFTLLSGAQDYVSGLDVPVVWGGKTYHANGVKVEGLKLKLSVGLRVDEQQIVIAAYPGDVLAGVDFLPSVAAGFLDGAYITRSRAFWERTTGIPANDYLQAPVGVIILSTMLVSEINKIGRTHVELTVKSPTKLLDLDMPRNYWGIGCIHTLFDGGCTLVKSSYGTNGTVGPGGTSLVVPWAGGVPGGGAGLDGIPNFQQGRILFTSGVLSNSQFSIGNNDAANLYMMYPFGQLPNSGDTFTVYPGCSKSLNTCNVKFANLNNFRGFPFTPLVFVSV